MHAYLATGQDQNLIESKVEGLIVKFEAKRLNFPLKKISDLKDLLKFTNLSTNEKTAIVIEDIDQASTDTQNAFLKSLEEPQKNLIYILTAKSEEAVLPTISSRCQTVKLTNSSHKLGAEKQKQIRDFLKMSTGQKLTLTSKIVKRDNAKEFLQEFISAGHEFAKEDPKIMLHLDEALKALTAINKNGNVQIQLTNFVINVET